MGEVGAPVYSFDVGNTDLQYFRPGDVVGEAPLGYQWNWVPQLTAESSTTDITSAIQAFNGNASDRADIKNLTASAAAIAILTFPEPIPAGSTIEFNWKRSGASSETMYSELLNANGSVHQKITSDSSTNSNQIVTFTNVPNTVNRLRLFEQAKSGSTSIVKFHTVKLNGEYLIDESLNMSDDIKVVSVDVPNNTMTVEKDLGLSVGEDITSLQPAGQGDVFSVDAVNNKLYVQNATGRWIGANKAGLSYSVAGPDKIDAPLPTADVELRSSLFETTPEDADILKNIVWEINGVETSAGTTNPFKPVLTTDTEYHVRVKHQGNSLDDSAYSSITKFTTGSVRTRDDLIASLLSRIETLEGN